jgi:hypothetical protein
MATGQELPRRVIDSIKSQTIPIRIITCITPGMINSSRSSSPEKLQGEINSRNLALDLAVKAREEFFIMQDRDTLQLKNDNYENLLNFIKADHTIGVAALFAHNSVEFHVRMCSLIYRLESVLNFRFHMDNVRKTCTCFAMKKDMDKNKWGCVYYRPNQILCEEI